MPCTNSVGAEEPNNHRGARPASVTAWLASVCKGRVRPSGNVVRDHGSRRVNEPPLAQSCGRTAMTDAPGDANKIGGAMKQDDVSPPLTRERLVAILSERDAYTAALLLVEAFRAADEDAQVKLLQHDPVWLQISVRALLDQLDESRPVIIAALRTVLSPTLGYLLLT